MIILQFAIKSSTYGGMFAILFGVFCLVLCYGSDAKLCVCFGRLDAGALWACRNKPAKDERSLRDPLLLLSLFRLPAAQLPQKVHLRQTSI